MLEIFVDVKNTAKFLFKKPKIIKQIDILVLMSIIWGLIRLKNSLELSRMPSHQQSTFAVAESTFCSRRLAAYQIE